MKRKSNSSRSRLSMNQWDPLEAVCGETEILSTGLIYSRRRTRWVCASGEDEFEFRPIDATLTWRDFLNKQIFGKNGIAIVFRAILAVIETEDYHLQIENLQDDDNRNCEGFRIRCFCNSSNQIGPVLASKCMSCDLDCTLTMGLHGGELQESCSELHVNENGRCSNSSVLLAKDSLLEEDAEYFLRLWIDAKARNMLIVTPLSHVESMADMSDEDLDLLWRGCDSMLAREQLPQSAVQALIMNSGKYRNHGHLHLKIKLTAREFENARLRWSGKRIAKWECIKKFSVEAARPVYEKEIAKVNGNITTVLCGELGDGLENPEAATEMERNLRDFCGKYGMVRSCDLVRRKSIAFVSFASHEDAARFIVGAYTKSVGRAKHPYFTWAKR